MSRVWASPRSLRAQLALFAISILVPALALMAWLLLIDAREGREAQRQELIATAQSISASIDLSLTRRLAVSGALAASDAIQRGDWAAAKQRAVQALAGPAEWLVLSDETGRQLFNTNERAAPVPSLPAQPSNVLAAHMSGKPSISNLFNGTGTGRLLVAIDTPVRAANHSLNLGYIIDPAQLLPIFTANPLPDRAVVSLLDRDGRMIARSQQHARFIGAQTAQGSTGSIAKPYGVAAGRSLDGIPTIVAYTRSPLSGWTTRVALRRSAFEAPLMRNLIGLAVVALLVITAGAGLAFYYSATIADELAMLERDAMAMGQGRVVSRRPGMIRNFEALQAALSEASNELAVHAERQRLLINELNHRVKNALASVQSLAVQAFRGNDPQAREKFETRLTALSAGHDLLTQRNWGWVDLGEVAVRCAAPHAERIAIGGPPVTLRPQAALAMCMCLHELTTNSIKYGALSRDTGRVAISWARLVGGDQVELTWRETGGPPVAQPRETGFGTRLLDRLVRSELFGKISRDFAQDGLVVVIDIGAVATSRGADELSAA